MVSIILKRVIAVLKKKPLTLWGISLLSVVLVGLGSTLFGIIPGVGLGIACLIYTSMTMIFLRGYRGEEVKSVDLFSCFKDWQTAKRVLCGTGWMALQVFLWALIPVAGIVIAIIKSYAYRLTPYILVTEPEVPALEAYKVSEQRTQGYKGKMFGAELLVWVIVFAAFFVLGLLSAIPFIGVLFMLATFVAYLAVVAFSGIFFGLMQAAFYEEITNPTVPLTKVGGAAAVKYCAHCGAPMNSDAAFCPKCGAGQ